MSSLPDIPIQRQTAFAPDGALEVEYEAIETTLNDHGVDIDHRVRNSRIEQPASDEFVDVRHGTSPSEAGRQGALFASDDDSQITLEGDVAATRCLFE